MKLLHSVTITVFDKENNLEKIEYGFDYLVPFDIHKSGLYLKSEYVGIDNELKVGNPITIYTLEIEKQRLITDFINYLRRMLSPIEKNKIVDNAIKFMEDDGIGYLRLNKEDLFNKKFNLTFDKECFHIKLKIATYPKSKDKAVEILKQLFFEKK